MRHRLVLPTVLLAALTLTATAALACNNSEGEMYSADTAKNQFTMKLNCGSEEVYTLKKETKITLNGKTASLSDLKKGDKLKVAHESSTDVLSVDATRA